MCYLFFSLVTLVLVTSPSDASEAVFLDGIVYEGAIMNGGVCEVTFIFYLKLAGVANFGCI